ncbi:carboxypeptidase-like regulatory domain-containing protein [uncultured Fibrella sp.]|uniref:carboxypeptidase-like regulatory domain-containing protein n=1 Tax=uncultured Fibrella sp. TaxID=1284596 RepID=UPI0035CABA18
MNRFCVLLICLLSAFGTQAQQRLIRGLVLDEATQPLPGVLIQRKGLATGVQSGKDGRFAIKSPPGSVTLTAHFIGYVSQRIVLKNNADTLTIRLMPDTRTLDEVVITGYGTTAKRSMTGSVGTISSARSRSFATSERTSVSPGRNVLPGRSAPQLISTNRPVQAGQLTAGEIHDYSKWTLWQDIKKSDLREYGALWRQVPAERYSIQLVTPDGFPVVDVPIRLIDSQRQVIWQTRTDNTGRGELWANLFHYDGDSAVATKGKLTVEATAEGHTYTLNRPAAFGKGTNSLTIGQACQGAPQTVDVAFVVDATGSMGDEIAFLKAELTDVINQSKQAATGSNIRLGSVFYRDKTDEYLTRHRDFSDQPDSTISFMKRQSAGGGGDYPEAVDTALTVALTRLSWSKTAKTRLLFLVLDAPPHDDDATKASLQRSVAKAAEMGIRIIPIAASGIDKSTEYLLRSMALGTNGTYVFLTDDSGIGDSHIKPTTDQYTVEKLNDLLVRLIAKFTQTPDCRPQVGQANTQVRYTEQGQPVDTTSKPNRSGGEPRFSYFPNPTRDYLTIESQDSIRELFVMDITGKVLMRETPDQTTTRLNMMPYPTGTYLFRFDAAQTWQAGRFLLNK